MIDPKTISEQDRETYYRVDRYFMQEDVIQYLEENDIEQSPALIDKAVDILVNDFDCANISYWDNVRFAVDEAIKTMKSETKEAI